jgi:hypothetical protein
VKRAGIFLTLISLMVVVFAGVALAAVIKGNDRANYLVGTPTDDAIYGYGGADRIHARGGPDALHLGGARTEATLSVGTTISVRWM